jgi:hypothetical protein
MDFVSPTYLAGPSETNLYHEVCMTLGPDRAFFYSVIWLRICIGRCAQDSRPSFNTISESIEDGW